MNNDTPLMECRGVSKKYGSKVALYDVNFTLERGKIIGLLGPNGSGKTTLIKLANGLLSPTKGEVLIDGKKIGVETKKVVSYLPERTYLNSWMRVEQILKYFADFYEDFHIDRALDMLGKLNINPKDRLKSMSKGTKEKVQLILVMSRDAKIYFLDEPIAGVDPAARDYILDTILTNYSPEASVVISTHLITDIERVLDEVLFVHDGEIKMQKSVDDVRAQYGKSVDEVFREVFKC